LGDPSHETITIGCCFGPIAIARGRHRTPAGPVQCLTFDKVDQAQAASTLANLQTPSTSWYDLMLNTAAIAG